MGELFSRLKRLAKSKGEVIIMNEKGDDAFVVMSLDRYEDLVEEMDFCPDDCDCMDDDFDLPDIDFSPPSDITEKIEEKDKEEDEKELMKRVNEDIAKWREEQEKSQEPRVVEQSSLRGRHKNTENTPKESKHPTRQAKTQKQEEKETSIPINVETEEKAESVLTEEEKYYLEPLE